MLKSKTLIFALALAILGALQASLELFNAILSPEIYGLLTMIVGVAVAILRVITTQPLADK